jgi:hypothetical protein
VNHYYHEVPGRLRLKNPVLKGKQDLCKKIEDSMACIAGIQSVKASVVTGSVTIYYDQKVLSSGQIIDIVSEQGYFDRNKAITSDQFMNHSFEKIGQAIGKAVFGAMVEKTFEGSALSLVAALL